MPVNPWLAVDGATSPRSRARDVRRSWERFLGDGVTAAARGESGPRGHIVESWRRSQDAGVDPFVTRIAPLVADPVEVAARWEVHPLAAAVPLIRRCVGDITDEGVQLIIVTDAAGMPLWIDGDERLRARASDTINLAEGTSWSEAGAGTNAIGTALEAEHAIQVFASEHFNEVVHAWTCAAAPVRDPDSGDIVGIVDLTGYSSTAHPSNFACAVATAQAVEAFLRSTMLESDARLRSRYDDLVRGRGRRALVSRTGRVLSGQGEGWPAAQRLSPPPGGGVVTLPSGAIVFAEPVGHGEGYILREAQAGLTTRGSVIRLRLLGEDRPTIRVAGQAVRLSRRHAEVLALLASRPAGMTSEELAADLYGDRGQPGTVRVQMSRLRKVLGGAIETEPYRLAADVETDVARVRGLLDRGAVREAVEQYAGPMLPHSEAPGIARDREELEAWVRQAAMSAEDREVLWAWLQSASGRDDLPAWKRLLADLDFRDPRRSLAAAHLQSLRAAFALR
jgi:hypothetical protein